LMINRFKMVTNLYNFIILNLKASKVSFSIRFQVSSVMEGYTGVRTGQRVCSINGVDVEQKFD
jgi:ribosome-associated toxin RatA of RatAB toxin-antitoxin module